MNGVYPGRGVLYTPHCVARRSVRNDYATPAQPFRNVRPHPRTIIHPCGMSGGRMQFAPTRVPGKLRCPRRGRPYTGTIIHPCGMSGGRMQFAPTCIRQTSLPPQGPPQPRVQSFIPAGCLGGRMQFAPTRVPGQTSLPPQGPPLHVPGKLRRRPQTSPPNY